MRFKPISTTHISLRRKGPQCKASAKVKSGWVYTGRKLTRRMAQGLLEDPYLVQLPDQHLFALNDS
jgi:hypothetical protein